MVGIDSANSAINIKDQLINSVQQYIWFGQETVSGQNVSVKYMGALIGTYSANSNTTKPGTWTWTYNSTISMFSVVSGTTLSASGIDSSVNTLAGLAKVLNMPALYQYSLPTTTPVSVAKVDNNSQTITITSTTGDSVTTYTIGGTYANGAWTYSYQGPTTTVTPKQTTPKAE